MSESKKRISFTVSIRITDLDTYAAETATIDGQVEVETPASLKTMRDELTKKAQELYRMYGSKHE